MKDNPLKSDVGHRAGTEENAAKLQIEAAKLQQKENARRRARLQQGSKSGSAAQLTATPQSSVTEQPPNLYQVAKINIPDNLGDLTRLLHAELTKIAQSQSILLTLWEKLAGQVAGINSLAFTVPVNFTAGVESDGVPIPTGRWAATYEWDAVPWNVNTGLYVERNSSDTASDMIIHHYGGAGSSCPAMQFRVAYKNGGISYRSARDGYGFEEDFIELATVPALAKLKEEIYRDLTAAGVRMPATP